MVCGYQYGPVDDKEVGVCRRQPLTVVIDGRRHRQAQQTVRSAVGRTKSLQLFLQKAERLIMFVRLIVTSYI